MKIGQNTSCLRISLIAALSDSANVCRVPKQRWGLEKKMLKLHLQSYKLCRNCNSWPCSVCLINYDLQISSVWIYKTNKQHGRHSVTFGEKKLVLLSIRTNTKIFDIFQNDEYTSPPKYNYGYESRKQVTYCILTMHSKG